MEAVLEAAAAAGASTAGYVAVRLPLEIKDLFEEWLAAEHPDRAKRVMSLVRQMRGGAAYSSEWGKRMTGEGPVAEVMSQRFRLARTRFGLDRKLEPLDLTQFAVPAKAGDQLSLF
jgi:DNA repair photolyase